MSDPHLMIMGAVLDEAGEPVADVEVSLTCPSATWLRADLTARSDKQGRFRIEGIGCPTTACSVRAAQGEATATAPLAPHCTRSTYHCRGSCTAAEVPVVLP